MEEREEEAAEIRTWSFYNRKFDEKISKQALQHYLARIISFDPDIIYKSYKAEDSLLLVLYFRTPPGRLLRKQWTNKYKTVSEFNNWLSQQDEPAEGRLLSIDDSLVGQVKENVKLMYPSDESVIKSTRLFIGNRQIGKTVVLKDNLIFGIRKVAGKENEFED
jgi:hypothetical protein